LIQSTNESLLFLTQFQLSTDFAFLVQPQNCSIERHLQYWATLLLVNLQLPCSITQDTHV